MDVIVTSPPLGLAHGVPGPPAATPRSQRPKGRTR